MLIKNFDLNKFVDDGYLQEANRNFFHPLGLALYVTLDDNGKITSLNVSDHQDDPEGIHYGLRDEQNIERIKKFNENFLRVNDERFSQKRNRLYNLGFWIEPIPDYPSTKSEQK